MGMISAMLRGKKVYGLEGDALKGYIHGCQVDSTYKASVEVWGFDGDRAEFTRGMRLAGVGEVIFRGH